MDNGPTNEQYYRSAAMGIKVDYQRSHVLAMIEEAEATLALANARYSRAYAEVCHAIAQFKAAP